MPINISRKNSIYLGLGIIVLFFASGILMLFKSNSEIASRIKEAEIKRAEIQIASGNPQSTEQDTPNTSVPITMNKFERHAMKDGKKAWEVKAEKGRYIPAENTAELEQSRLFFYRKDDSKIELNAQNSKITFSGNELGRADMSGGVELVFNDKVNLKSESASYNKADDLIIVPGKVIIDTENIQLEGSELIAHVSKHEVQINKDVSTVIYPKKSKK